MESAFCGKAMHQMLLKLQKRPSEKRVFLIFMCGCVHTLVVNVFKGSDRLFKDLYGKH